MSATDDKVDPGGLATHSTRTRCSADSGLSERIRGKGIPSRLFESSPGFGLKAGCKSRGFHVPDPGPAQRGSARTAPLRFRTLATPTKGEVRRCLLTLGSTNRSHEAAGRNNWHAMCSDRVERPLNCVLGLSNVAAEHKIGVGPESTGLLVEEFRRAARARRRSRSFVKAGGCYSATQEGGSGSKT